MIIPEKPTSSDSQAMTAHSGSSQAADTRSIMTQEPPPYSETPASSTLSRPAPHMTSPNPRSNSGPSSSQYSPPGRPAQPSLHVPMARGRARSFGTPQGHAPQSSQLRSVSHYTPQPVQPPVPPKQQTHPPLVTSSPGNPPSAHRRPNSLPGPQALPPITRAPSSPSVAPDAPQPQYCNHLLERKDRSSVRGTWYLDTSLVIPEPLIPDISHFNGVWNEMDKKSIRQREKEKKKREGGGWGRKKVVDTTPLKPLKNEGVRPNLMLWSKDGGVQADINLVSGAKDMAVIVAESHDGSVKLNIKDVRPQPLRLFAIATDGSVRVRIPTTFEGAISMTTEDGSVNVSEGIKSRLMTFSSTNKSLRAYIGDWKSADFSSPTSSPSLSSTSSPQTPDSEPKDPFKNWAGPLVHLHSKDGSVHIAYIDEDTSSMFSKVMKSIKDGFLGLNMEDESGNWGNSAMAGTSPATLPLPRGVAMQAYRVPPNMSPPRSQAYAQPSRPRITGPGANGSPRQYAQAPELGGAGLFEDKGTYGRKSSR
ncbi:hypothetical protein RhiJN_10891 [Ceratobasidium sp. AG-Ba]|nr:hypothetical protein RhiJN_10891 [Ceratobasidium sp. AG-Ba]QRW11622.1 hypothetical protein RhiLY_10621 [Ceratobasidium sp. AG-Ba]